MPLSYTSQDKRDFNSTAPNAWMECRNNGASLPKTISNLPESDQWVIFNIQLSSFYKANYDAQNWRLLIKTLTEGDFESIHVMNRAQLVDDILYLARTGMQSYEVALELISYLKRERDYLPWDAALLSFQQLGHLLRDTPHIEFFKVTFWASVYSLSYYLLLQRLMRKLLTPVYQHLGGIDGNSNSTQSQDQILLKAIVIHWACQYEAPDCVAKSLVHFGRWKSETYPDEKNPIPVDMRASVYCAAIKNGTNEDWEFLWTRYQKSNVAAEQGIILIALGCSQDVKVLQRYLGLIFDPSEVIRKQDSVMSFASVVAGKVGKSVCKTYFMNNVERLCKQYVLNLKIKCYFSLMCSLFFSYHPIDGNMGQILRSFSGITDRKEYDEFKAFVNKSERFLKGLEQTIDQTMEAIRINVQWMEQPYKQLSRFLEKYT